MNAAVFRRGTPVISDPQSFLTTVQTHIQSQLNHFLEEQNHVAPRLHAAMIYSVLNGGKRIRPALVYAACCACGGEPDMADAAAIAVELIHCYSLVHDDLPCMDDDDLRRGMPTCHKRFSEDVALLAGDTLQALAFASLSTAGGDAERRLQMLHILANAARDMAIGQTLDLEAEQQSIDLERLETIHRHKTGALIRASLALGALSAGPVSADLLARFEHFGDRLGLAFQVHDDILDVIGDTDILGKAVGSDQRLGKATYPQLLGLEAACALSAQLHQQSLAALAELPGTTGPLTAVTDYLISRDR